MAEATQLPIWVGLTGLMLSGMVLRSPVLTVLTRVKLALVLVVALNGLHAGWLHQRLLALHGRPVPRTMLARSGIGAVVSQVGWWGATMIGFLNSHS